MEAIGKLCYGMKAIASLIDLPGVLEHTSRTRRSYPRGGWQVKLGQSKERETCGAQNSRLLGAPACDLVLMEGVG